MASREQRNARPNRESLSKRLGRRVTLALHARDGGCCVYCRATAETSGAPLQLDHLTPRSLGGADAPTNLVLACRVCNRTRSTTPLATWCRQLGMDARALRRHAATVSL